MSSSQENTPTQPSHRRTSSGLSILFADANVANIQQQDQDRTPRQRIPRDPAGIDISGAVTPGGSSSGSSGHGHSADDFQVGFPVLKYHDNESGLRDFCTGQPRLTYLSTSPPRPHRRSTLSDTLELDHILEAARISHEGELYLPLDPATLRALTVFLNGAKPIANLSLFSKIIFANDANRVDIQILLGQVGHQVKKVVIKGGMDLGGWASLQSLCPNVKEVKFQH